jgi:hypothetical protein
MKHTLRAMSLMLLVCTGCLHVTYVSSGPRGATTHTGTNHFFLWGLVGRPEVDAAAACPGGVARLSVYESFLDGFLAVITGGIYTPHSWEAWCVEK